MMQDVQQQVRFRTLLRKKALMAPTNPSTRTNRGPLAALVSWIAVVAALTLTVLATSGGIARASTADSGPGRNPTVVCAQSHVTGCMAALVKAERRWPGARVILTPTQLPAGAYLVPDTGGQFAHLVVQVSVRPLNATTRAATPSASRAALCWGCVYGVTANVTLDSFLWGHQELDTYNGVKYGYYAWNINLNPWCSGAGSCSYPAVGVGGNWTWTVNPWDNQYVNYWGCCTRTAFLRAYVNGYAQVSGWAVMH
jgi:hypothetical protein